MHFKNKDLMFALLFIVLIFVISFIIVSKENQKITAKIIFEPEKEKTQLFLQTNPQKNCECKKMIVKLFGTTDEDLEFPSQSLGAPQPTEKFAISKNLGPSVGYVKAGLYKTDLRIGWNFEVQAEIQGDTCKENQYIKNTMEYIGLDGQIQISKSHDSGYGEPNLLLSKGNAGYDSKIWAPDYVESEQDYCKKYEGSCKEIKTREKTKNKIHWIDAPGAFVPNDYLYYDNKMSILPIVRGTHDSCYCTIDIRTTAVNEENQDIVTLRVSHIDGNKCEIQTDSNKKNVVKRIVIKK